MPRFNVGKLDRSGYVPTVEQVLGSRNIAGVDWDAQTLSQFHEQIDAFFAPPILDGTSLLNDFRNDQWQGSGVLKIDNGLIDHCLGGGLQKGRLTEIYGESGSGKTQFCLSTCAVAAGVGERVVYIDTSNAFSSQRIIQILERRAEQLPRHDQLPLQNNYLEEALERIIVINAYSVHTVLQVLDSLLRMYGIRASSLQPEEPNLDQHASHHNPPSLIILDSLGAVITPVLGGARNLQGHAALSTCAMLMKQVAAQLRAAVLVSNHVVRGTSHRSRYDSQNRQSETTQPALGLSWRHQAHLRLELFQTVSKNGERLGDCTKSGTLRIKYSTHLPVNGRCVDVELSEAGVTAVGVGERPTVGG